MNDEELDDLLGSLEAPAPRPNFWEPIDQALAQAEAFAESPPGDGHRSTARSIDGQSDGLDASVVELRPTQAPERLSVGRVLAAAAAVIVVISGVALLGRSNNSEPTEAATDGSNQTSIPDDVEPLTVEDVPLLLAGETLALEPQLEDFNDDQLLDAVVLTEDDGTGQLAVVVFDGLTRQTLGTVEIEGETIAELVVRPERIIVITRTETTEVTTELVLSNDRLIIDRSEPNSISDWTIDIEGRGVLGLIIEQCSSVADFQLVARTETGTFVSLGGPVDGEFILIDGPDGSFEGAIVIESLEPFQASALLTTADDSAAGAATAVSVAGPGCGADA